MLTSCKKEEYLIPLYHAGHYWIDENENLYEEYMDGPRLKLRDYDTKEWVADWDSNENLYVNPGPPPIKYKPPISDWEVGVMHYLGPIIRFGDGNVINLIAGDVADAQSQLEALAAFISSDQSMEYDVDVADLLSSVLDFTNVSNFGDFESQCSAGKSQLDQFTAPQICTSFQNSLSFFLSDPAYIINPEYKWQNNSFHFALSGNELEMTAQLSGEQIFDVTLTKDGAGEVTLSGTVKGMAVTTAMQARPILIYQPFLDEADEWGFERDEL